MKQYLEIYNPNKTYVLPNMQVASPEYIKGNYAMVNVGTCVVVTDIGHKMFYAIEFIDAMRDRLDVLETLTDSEALVAMEAVLNAPAPVPEPTAEERIAASMEYQNLFL